MTHISDQNFHSAVEAFLSRTGIAPSRFGELSCGDRNLLTDLRAGNREFKRSTIEKVLKWMSGFDAGQAFVAVPPAAESQNVSVAGDRAREASVREASVRDSGAPDAGDAAA